MESIIELIQTNWLTTALSATLLLAFLNYVLRPSRYNLPPEPFGLPFLGHLPFLGRNIHLTLHEYSKKLGNIYTIRFGLKRAVILQDYDIIKETYKMEGMTDRVSDLVKISPNFASVGDMNGQEWQVHRKFAVSALRGANRERSTEDIIQEEIRKIEEKLAPHLSKDADMRDFMSVINNNISFTLIWGKSYEEDAKMTKFLLELQRLTREMVAWKFFVVAFGIPDALQDALIPPLRRSNQAIAKMDEFMKQEIESHKEKFDPDNPRDFIDMSLKEIEKSEGSRKVASYEHIRGDGQALLLAASETTRSTLEWLFILLSKHQDMQEQIHKELEEVIGGNNPAWSDHERCVYTEAFITESQRFFTMIPINLPRIAPRDIKIRGYDIPKGTWILANFWSVHNDPKLWDHPENFNPNRFISKDGEKLIVPEFWIPFSFGSRNCLGDKVAKMEIFLIVATFVQKYKILPPSNGISLDGELIITYSAVNPFVRLEKRK